MHMGIPRYGYRHYPTMYIWLMRNFESKSASGERNYCPALRNIHMPVYQADYIGPNTAKDKERLANLTRFLRRDKERSNSCLWLAKAIVLISILISR